MTLDNNRSPISSLWALLFFGLALLATWPAIHYCGAPGTPYADAGFEDGGTFDPCDSSLSSIEYRQQFCLHRVAP